MRDDWIKHSMEKKTEAIVSLDINMSAWHGGTCLCSQHLSNIVRQVFNEFKVVLVYITILGHPGLHSKTLSQLK